jgi:RNA polymerase sigma factor (sigma-70 family)
MPKMWRRKRCCALIAGSNGCATGHDSAGGWFESRFALRWTGFGLPDHGRSVKRGGCTKISNPSPSGVNAEFRQQFERAIENLPESQRRVILLRFFEDRTLQEIAALTGHPLGTVKSRLFFARKTLAEKLRCFVNPTVNR